MKEPIYFYTRSMPYWGLSNFSPPGITVAGLFWSTVEHYFQARKFAETEMQDRIRRVVSPKIARQLGQSRAFPIHPEWNTVREEIMLNALRLKFTVPAAQQLLLSTGERSLIETSPFDYFWGSGQDGSGQNRLGQLLVQVRTELRHAGSLQL